MVESVDSGGTNGRESNSRWLLLADAVPGHQGRGRSDRVLQEGVRRKRNGAHAGPGGRIMHAEVKIGNSMLMLADENPERGHLSPKTRGGNTSSVMLYTDDVDAMFKKAVAAGAKADQPPTDMFWGDRMGNITDPFGHTWAIATHKEDVSPEEMEKRHAECRVPRVPEVPGVQRERPWPF